jgi:histone H3/H4
MSKKQVQPTRDIVATLAREIPAQLEPWKPFKELKAHAYAVAVAAWDAKKEGRTEKEIAKDEPAETDFGIEDARVRRHLDKLGLNASITAYVRAIKDKYKAPESVTKAPESVAKAPEGTVKAPPEKPKMSQDDIDRCSAVLNERIRIGNSVPAYLRGFCEEIVNDLAHIAIEAALRADRKIVLDSHIFANDGYYLAASQFKNLYQHLPSFMEAHTKYSMRAKQALAGEITDTYLAEFSRFISATGQSRYKAIRKNISDFVNKSHRDEDESATEPSAPEDKKDARFTFYIRKIVRIIRMSDPRFSDLRFSKHIIPFIDNILTEFIQLVAMRAIVHITTTGAETVSKSIINSIILGMFATPYSLMERDVAGLEKLHVTRNVTKKITEGDTTKHVKCSEECDQLTATLNRPAFMTFVDNLYPLPARVLHPRISKDDIEAMSAPVPAPVAVPAAPVAPKVEQKRVPRVPK